jgi:polyphosphate kinase
LELNQEQKEFVESYFKDHMLPYVQPVILIKNKIRPFLNNAALYLTILMKNKDPEDKETYYGIVKIPSDHLPRFILLPSENGRKDLIMLDDIVRQSISWMFPGFEIIDTFSIKLTRDAELYIDDEYTGDLVQKIKTSLAKRHVGPASRFVYDREMPKELLTELITVFELEKLDILKEGRYHNNFDFFKFPDFGMEHLKNSPLPPLKYEPLEVSEEFFSALEEKDHLLHFPYQSYESVIRWFEMAANDPYVTHIKITQYRVAKKSRIMEALMHAVKLGKQVSVFIEVKARFDEEANLEWGEKLEKAGVTVHYSFPGVKVHSKLAIIRRQKDEEIRLYAYLGTGNFHEETSKIYSDFGLFTTDTQLTNEIARIFNFLETVKRPEQPFDQLLVGKFNLRQKLVDLIDFEINEAKNGKPARLILKMNGLQDPDMIDKLYEASRAGVKIDLIIRGICCINPGIQGHSENIKAISIVDRFLEHSRIFYFYHGGSHKVYLSSADWMTRNLSYRVETAFPILDEKNKSMIMDLLQLQLSDNVKARLLDNENVNKYSKNNSELPIRSQIESYFYLKRKG